MRRLLGLHKVSSLKALLLYWIAGSGIALVLVYSSLVEYKFRFGAILMLEANLERYAEYYEKAYLLDKATPLPTGIALKAYKNISHAPAQLASLLAEKEYKHRKITVFPEDEYAGNFADAYLTPGVCDHKSCDLLFVFSYQLSNGEWLYLVYGFAGSEKLYHDNTRTELILILLTLLIIASISVLAWLLVRKVSTPVEELANWAKQLKGEEVTNSPDFKYKELNQVAAQLVQASISIRESVEKEHKFLQHASHELRTPLATASGNIEILNLIGKQSDKTDQEINALGRLSNAINDMTQLTETILWLNRDNDILPEEKQISLSHLVESLVRDNEYLISGKSVAVEITGEGFDFISRQMLCSIVINNLIRNAFQYTTEGKVNIVISGSSIEITNINTNEELEMSNEVYGFGLGLALVEQIAEKEGWQYQYEKLPSGWISNVNFEKR